MVQSQERQRLIVGISGASGALYGIHLLRIARQIPQLESHLIITPAARLTISAETDWSIDQVAGLADMFYDDGDLGAPLASGSVATAGMAIAPCSVKTLSSVAHSYASSLLTRAADVTLKEGRPLVLLVRETPLHIGHLRLMVQVAEMGGIIYPPVPALYGRPASVEELIDATAGRVLARLGFPNPCYPIWSGTRPADAGWV